MTPEPHATADQFLQLSSKIDILPIVHGSGDFAIAVRQQLLSRNYQCLAVPLPESFQEPVLELINQLPAISAVVQLEPDDSSASYVPIDPCQPVIAGIRTALSERMAIRFIDLEVSRYEPIQVVSPDPFALKQVSPAEFAAAMLPSDSRPEPGSQHEQRIRRMAFELNCLELEFDRILVLASITDWVWIREAFRERLAYPPHETYFPRMKQYRVEDRTLAMFLGELPYITAMYERARQNLDDDDNLSIDGVKSLLLEARDRWMVDRDPKRNWVTVKSMQILFQYARNLTLMARRLTPDLYTLVSAAKQIGGDNFALEVLKTARDYNLEHAPLELPRLRMGIGQGELQEEGVLTLKSRLPGLVLEWHSLELKPDRPKPERPKQRTRWNNYSQCSYTPEDVRIESFHKHVREQAKLLVGIDLARTEKLTTSLKDGIDIRETLRHWHTGDLYVKEVPPSKGGLDVVTFLFDTPASTDKYPWQTTWHSEFAWESTISFFATDFKQEIIGPGIAKSQYGGVMFLNPCRFIPDVWQDPRFAGYATLEERLVAASVFYSNERHIAIVSHGPLRTSWRKLAAKAGRKLVHLPMSRFSIRMIDRLRTFHVLNGKEIRSYAAKYIQDT